MTGHDGHTIDIGYVHVLTEPGGACVDTCPHPDHRPTPPAEPQPTDADDRGEG